MFDQLQERHFAKLARLVEEHTGIRLPPAKRTMVEGRLRDFYAQRCLVDQPIANEMKYGKKTVGQIAKEAGMKIIRFVHWELPKE